MFSDYIVFVDESGDHSLDSIDEDYPIFVLAFCLMRKISYVDTLTPKIRQLKFDTFGHDNVVLHEIDIRKKLGAFASLGKEAREDFLQKSTHIVEGIEFTLYAVVIDKIRLKKKYFYPAHPYHMAMQFGLERIKGFLRLKGENDKLVHFVCEARGKREDAELEQAFRHVCDGGNYRQEHYTFEICMTDKKSNCEGLQMVDLVVRPFGMSVLRPTQVNRAMEVLEGKFATNMWGEKRGSD